MEKKQYTQEDLDRVLDELHKGPIGKKNQAYWNRSVQSKLTNQLLDKQKDLMTKDARKKAAKSNTGKKRTKEFCKKLSKARTGLIIGDVPSKFIPIYLILPDGTERRYESLKYAAQDLGINVPGINSVLRGRMKTYRGYTFRYA